MDFREMAQKMILCALNCGLSSKDGSMYKKAVKRELIGQYAETFWITVDGERKEIKFFGDLSGNSLDKKVWNVLLVSKAYSTAVESRKKYKMEIRKNLIMSILNRFDARIIICVS